jgi:hypothetical protein
MCSQVTSFLPTPMDMSNEMRTGDTKPILTLYHRDTGVSITLSLKTNCGPRPRAQATVCLIAALKITFGCWWSGFDNPDVVDEEHPRAGLVRLPTPMKIFLTLAMFTLAKLLSGI